MPSTETAPYSSISVAADICTESNRQHHSKAKEVMEALTGEAIKLNLIVKSTQIRHLPYDEFNKLFEAAFMSIAMHLTGQTETELDIRGIGNIGIARFYDLIPKKPRSKKRPRSRSSSSSSSSSSIN